MNKKVIKIAVVGAVLAVAVDYYLDPAVKKAVGLR